MSTSSSTSFVLLVFNGENYHIWAVKMRFYLRSQGLWNIVMSEADPPPLGANPTVAQMKAHEQEKLKKDTSPSYIQDLLLRLKREFELMKMKDNKFVKDYSSRLMDVVNQMRLLGEALTDQKVEQRVLMRGDEATKGVFQANHKGKSFGNLQGKKFFKNNKGKAEGSSRKGNFSSCSHCSRTNHAEKDCWYKVEDHVFSAKIDESVVWHKRYGHFNLKSLKFMQEAGMVEDMLEITVNAQTCESCELEK
ncbi:hypothetical protein AAG906_018661 [Vitis piasezkii]